MPLEFLDLSNITEDQDKKLKDFIDKIIFNALDYDEYESEWVKVEKAIKQSYIQKPNQSDPDPYAPVDVEGEKAGTDEDDLFIGLILRTYKTLLSDLKEITMPVHGDNIAVNRKSSPVLKQSGMGGFIEFANQCWENLLKKEDLKFRRKRKLETALSQFIIYGRANGIAFFDPETQHVDLKIADVRNFGFYPSSDEWEKSNKVWCYPVNYTDLLFREDLDREIVEKLRPSQKDYDRSDDRLRTPGERHESSSRYSDTDTEFGQIKLFNVHIPSLYITGNDKDSDLIARNVFIVCAVNPNMDPRAKKEEHSIVILKALQDADIYTAGFMYAPFDDVLPSVEAGNGPLIPLLPNQSLLNGFYRSIAAEITYALDPAISVTNQFGENIIDPPVLEGGAVFENMSVDPIMAKGMSERLNAYLMMTNKVESDSEAQTGVNRLSTGASNVGFRTKAEITQQVLGASGRTRDPAFKFDEFLKLFYTNVVVITQRELVRQIQSALESVEIEVTQENMPMIMEQILASNALFNRIVNFMEIEEIYNNWYNHQMNKISDNNNKIQKAQELTANMQRISQQVSKLPRPFVEPDEIGQLLFNKAGVENARAQHEANQQMLIQQLQGQYAGLQQEFELIKKEVENIPEPPAPSLLTYYTIISDILTDSDVFVTGSTTALLKETFRQSITEFLQILGAMPPETRAKYDFDKIMQVFGKATSVNSREIMLSEPEIQEAINSMRRQQMLLAQQQQQGNG